MDDRILRHLVTLLMFGMLVLGGACEDLDLGTSKRQSEIDREVKRMPTADLAKRPESTPKPRPAPAPTPAPTPLQAAPKPPAPVAAPEDALIAMLGKGNTSKQVGVINKLGVFKTQKVLDALAPYCSDKELRIAKQAMMAVGGIGGPKAVAVLTPNLKDKGENMRGAALMALAQCHRKLVPAALVIERLTKDKAKSVRAVAAYAAGALWMWDAVVPLISAMRDPDVMVRTRAYESVSRILGSKYRFNPKGSPAEREQQIKEITTAYPRHKSYFDRFMKRLDDREAAEAKGK